MCIETGLLRHRRNWVVWGAHLSQNFVQPLQRSMKVDLNPAGRACDILAMVLGSPALKSKNGATWLCQTSRQPPGAQDRPARHSPPTRAASGTWELHSCKYKTTFSSARHPKMSPHPRFPTGITTKSMDLERTWVPATSETLGVHAVFPREGSLNACSPP